MELCLEKPVIRVHYASCTAVQVKYMKYCTYSYDFKLTETVCKTYRETVAIKS